MLKANEIYDFLYNKNIIDNIIKIDVNTKYDYFSSEDGELKELKNFDSQNNYFGFHNNESDAFYIGDFTSSEIKEIDSDDLEELTKDLDVKELNKLVKMILKNNKIKCVFNNSIIEAIKENDFDYFYNNPDAFLEFI